MNWFVFKRTLPKEVFVKLSELLTKSSSRQIRAYAPFCRNIETSAIK